MSCYKNTDKVCSVQHFLHILAKKRWIIGMYFDQQVGRFLKVPWKNHSFFGLWLVPQGK